jgi:hypothetical protein
MSEAEVFDIDTIPVLYIALGKLQVFLITRADIVWPVLILALGLFVMGAYGRIYGFIIDILYARKDVTGSLHFLLPIHTLFLPDPPSSPLPPSVPSSAHDFLFIYLIFLLLPSSHLSKGSPLPPRPFSSLSSTSVFVSSSFPWLLFPSFRSSFFFFPDALYLPYK